ncbi:MAG: hypothetical protein CMJ42_11145 [Phyllobacteriaceae bacterium]|nr:hypothetical protein [Phyllobacteriaceae bacterium]
MERFDAIGTRGQQQLFGGLVMSVLGIGLICMSGLGLWGPLANTGAALVLTGTLLWLRGAVTYQNELMDAATKQLAEL